MCVFNKDNSNNSKESSVTQGSTKYTIAIERTQLIFYQSDALDHLSFHIVLLT